MCRLLIFAALIGTAFSAGTHEYDYSDGPNGPAHWATHFPTCGAAGNWRQSPVDIRDDHIRFDQSLSVPTMSAGYYSSHPAHMTNNGKHVTFKFDHDDDLYVSIYLHGQPRKYRLDSGHFHWGAAGKMGSEHTMNGRQFAGELHLVHYNYDKKSIADALEMPDDLLVLGAFIEMSMDQMHDPEEYTKLFSHFKNITMPNPEKGAHLMINPSHLLPEDKNYVYNYDGGLTTPGCNGIVQWFVFKETVHLHQSTIQKNWWEGPRKDNFDFHGPNWRPVQPLHTRMIRTNDMKSAHVDGPGHGGHGGHTGSAGSVQVCVMTTLLCLITRFL